MAKKKEQKETTVPIEEGTALPIEWHIPDNLVTRFVTNMIIQTIEHEFKISFFEVKPPLIFSEEDKKKKGLTAKAECVASIIVAPERLPNFINALNTHLSKYKTIQEKKDS